MYNIFYVVFDCSVILVMNTFLPFFPITYVEAEVSSARSSIKSAYITIMLMHKIDPLYEEKACEAPQVCQSYR